MEEPWERSLSVLNTRENIVIKKWGYVRFIDVDMVLCYRKSACEWTLRGRGQEKKEIFV